MDLADALDLGDEAVVALVGAGGKKTAMGTLVEAGLARNRRIGYTTTTHSPPPEGIDLVVANPFALPGALPEGLPGTDEPVALAAERVPDPDRAAEKVRGFDPTVVDRLAATGRFDWLLVKADGARRREFKAPGPDEPQIPASASVVVPVASVAAVGAPLDEDRVHRPERVAALTGREPGECLTVEDVATVLASPAGGLKRVPSEARVVPMVNKADGPDERHRARTVIERALAATDRFDAGLVTSFRNDELAIVRRSR
ncbi:MAG: selenium cofactor biosynthesis protein YqeC [Haloarculaceae archaeon]